MFLETLDALKHVIWPTRCASCDVLLPQPKDLLCEECRASVLEAPQIPLSEPIDCACAIFRYEGAVQNMIAKWKYHEDYSAQKALLSFLPENIERLKPFIPDNACLIPVPPHPRRLRERGFDPVWTFAEKLHKILVQSGIHTDFRDDVLTRTRHTPHQAGLTHDERVHNLDGAFKVSEKFAPQKVILIDDVTTTGATAAACATTLKAAGAPWVGFVALAHAVK
ncbi:MAG: ComF family protein [Proteobacteria bacterium]|nr:ComF family protein [Pseudomonadota bacterium]